MGDPDRVIFIERLNIAAIAYLLLFGRRYRKIFYADCPVILQRLLALTRRLNPAAGRARMVGYPDFPGSFFRAQEEMYFHSNDALFHNHSSSMYLKLVAVFTGEPRSLLAVKKELLIRYTNQRTNACIFLKYLASEHGVIDFIPRDSIPPDSFLSPPHRISGYARVPRGIVYWNRAADRLKGLAGSLAFPAIMVGVAVMVLRRGIVLKADPVHYRYGFDLQAVGLKRDRGLILGKFFLYDDTDFHPSRILHVVRHRLEDEDARKSLEPWGVPFVEFDRIPVPVRFLAGRIMRDLLAGSIIEFLRHPTSRGTHPLLLIPSVAAIKMHIEAELFYRAYDVDLFIARDEYSPYHIARTVVANRFGNATVGFQWADYWDRGEALSHFVFNRYALWGEFYREYLEKTLEYTDGCEVVGANIYASDILHRLSADHHIPQKYREIAAKYRVVAIMGSSVAPEISLTREAMLRFYADTLEIAHAIPNTFCVLKPKIMDMNQELREMIQKYPRAVLETDLHTYEFLPVPELVICIGNSTIGIESLMLRKKVFYYDLTAYPDHLYRKYSPLLVATTKEELRERMDLVLRENSYVDEKILEEIRRRHGLAFDGAVMERFRGMCRRVTETLDLGIPRDPGEGGPRIRRTR